jgi:tetratricopeptide (TPR) repeat protein
MKLKLTILFLAVVSLAMAQKREMRKIEKAIDKEDFAEAFGIFNSIDENAVETKYAGTYQFYKAASLIDLTGITKAGLADLRAAEAAFYEAKALGFNDLKLELLLENRMQKRKLDIANEKVAAGEPQIALSLVEEVYEKDPRNLDLLYDAGNLAYTNSVFDKAIEKYDLLLEKKYTGERTNYLATNQDGVVEKFSNKTVRDFSIKSKSHTLPTSETTPSNLGDIVLKTVWLYTNQKQNKQKAILIYETALQNHPKDTSLELVKADVYLTLGMMEEYKEAVENIDLDITDPKVFDNLGQAAMKSKNYESAMRYFKSSLKLAPDDYFALVSLSNAYLETGNLEQTTAAEQEELYLKAIRSLEKAHEVKPEEKAVMGTLLSLYDFLQMKEKSAEIKSKM